MSSGPKRVGSPQLHERQPNSRLRRLASSSQSSSLSVNDETKMCNLPSTSGSRPIDEDLPTTTSELVLVQFKAEMICLGSIRDVPVQLQIVPQKLNIQNETEFVHLALFFDRDRCLVQSRAGENLGVLSSKVSRALKKCIGSGKAVAEPFAPLQGLQIAIKARKRDKISGNMTIEIALYSKKVDAGRLGQTLTSSALFLQPPSIEIHNVEYDNPQDLKITEMETDIGHDESGDNTEPVKSRTVLGSLESRSLDVAIVLDHLQQPTHLRQNFTNAHIKTQLKGYQKEAIDFMVRRETENSPQSLSLWVRYSSGVGLPYYRHAITNAKHSSSADFLGGILADDMGLGKSLTVLSTIVDAIPRAVDFAAQRVNRLIATKQVQSVVPSKATLILVPSALLLDSWINEVTAHLSPGFLQCYKYHGDNRNIDMVVLLKHDIILTTYATLVYEFERGASILHQVHWYRFVLDEAHTIRNPSTKQFRAVNAIHAQIRWCLTGTPIQNGLTDLAALIQFMRMPILEDISNFRKFVVAPSHAGSFGNLRKILHSICLRRTRHILGLPEPVVKTELLELSREERLAYSQLGQDCRHAIDMAISSKNNRKVNQNVLEAFLRMRLFCNHGLEGLLRSIPSRGLPSDRHEILSYLETVGKANCEYCGCDILTMAESADQDGGFLTVCRHLLCSDCLPRYKADLSRSQEGSLASCPVCQRRGLCNAFLLGGESDEPPTFQRQSFPTKISRIANIVKQQAADEKSVIFSVWKKTIDLLGEALSAEKIPFHRIDGSDILIRRRQKLSEFESGTHASVLLMTLGTGAVGLNNLVVANNIHIIEPQWNPSMEIQAIGRILRLGQTRNVKVIRYIVDHTVEQSVRDQQMRKLQLSRGGFTISKDDDASSKIQELMSLLCPE